MSFKILFLFCSVFLFPIQPAHSLSVYQHCQHSKMSCKRDSFVENRTSEILLLFLALGADCGLVVTSIMAS